MTTNRNHDRFIDELASAEVNEGDGSRITLEFSIPSVNKIRAKLEEVKRDVAMLEALLVAALEMNSIDLPRKLAEHKLREKKKSK
tara:strand:+ start:69 stop:323 length:255 start_codon:yes stop_codon:yes gene_type:complete